GTYLDAPFHYHADGDDIAALALERLTDVPAIVVRAAGERAIGARALPAADAITGHAVLIQPSDDAPLVYQKGRPAARYHAVEDRGQ
ncbi:MAG: cyclase family protein, partial [Streptosporangiaceae bacterium]